MENPQAVSSQIEPSKNASALKRMSMIPSILTLLVGVIVGFLAGIVFVGIYNANKLQVILSIKSEPAEIDLPTDAVQIQSCSDHRGSLYVKPNNIPVGPVFMVYNGKVIGIEFMLAQSEFLQGRSFKYLSGLRARVDHINIGLLSKGHEGYAIPHYHVDMYLVSKSVENSIVCPDSGNLTPSQGASASAQPTMSENGNSLINSNSSTTSSPSSTQLP